MKVWHVLKQEWHWLWQGRFPVAAILFLLPLAFTLAFGIIYYQNSVERIVQTGQAGQSRAAHADGQLGQ